MSTEGSCIDNCGNSPKRKLSADNNTLKLKKRRSSFSSGRRSVIDHVVQRDADSQETMKECTKWQNEAPSINSKVEKNIQIHAEYLSSLKAECQKWDELLNRKDLTSHLSDPVADGGASASSDYEKFLNMKQLHFVKRKPAYAGAVKKLDDYANQIKLKVDELAHSTYVQDEVLQHISNLLRQRQRRILQEYEVKESYSELLDQFLNA